MTGAQVDDVEAVAGLRIVDGDESVCGPDVLSDLILGIANVRAYLLALGRLELASESTSFDFFLDTLPGQSLLDLFPKVPALLLQAPDEGAGDRAEGRSWSALESTAVDRDGDLVSR